MKQNIMKALSSIIVLTFFIYGCAQKDEVAFKDGYKEGQKLATAYLQHDGKSPVDIIAKESCKLSSEVKSEFRDKYHAGCIAGFTDFIEEGIQEARKRDIEIQKKEKQKDIETQREIERERKLNEAKQKDMQRKHSESQLESMKPLLEKACASGNYEACSQLRKF